MNRLIYELVGPPGTGKSTYCDNLEGIENVHIVTYSIGITEKLLLTPKIVYNLFRYNKILLEIFRSTNKISDFLKVSIDIISRLTIKKVKTKRQGTILFEDNIYHRMCFLEVQELLSPTTKLIELIKQNHKGQIIYLNKSPQDILRQRKKRANLGDKLSDEMILKQTKKYTLQIKKYLEGTSYHQITRKKELVYIIKNSVLK